jgi:uncharacterized membrane protein
MNTKLVVNLLVSIFAIVILAYSITQPVVSLEVYGGKSSLYLTKKCIKESPTDREDCSDNKGIFKAHFQALYIMYIILIIRKKILKNIILKES